MVINVNEEVKHMQGIVSGRSSPVGRIQNPYQPCVAPVESFSLSEGVRPLESLSKLPPNLLTLVMEDGSMYLGYSFGSEKKSVSGELVFQTGMTGYPEALTDPSNKGYLLVLTFPLIGNYGVPDDTKFDELLKDRLEFFESSKIHVTGLIIGNLSSEYSHYLAKTSLSEWLIKNEIPAMYGVDTRAITKKIREQGAMIGKMLFQKSLVGPGEPTSDMGSEGWMKTLSNVEWNDINKENLVSQVSTKVSHLYVPKPGTELKHPTENRTLRIVAVDLGLKNKQLTFMVGMGLEVKLVPWDHDFLKEDIIDGLFLSNGPGNPDAIPRETVVARAQKAIKLEKFPIFGICMGHQLLSIASGASLTKMKYGNRGANIPCTDLRTGRCYITSQNHGYAINANTYPDTCTELFINANDGTNEGMMYKNLPYFSVQFHPESTPGPSDTEFLFADFIDLIKRCAGKSSVRGIPVRGGDVQANIKNEFMLSQSGALKKVGGRIVNGKIIRKVLVLGSGGLSIGQAGEFDYSGSQAIKALKEEGIYTILINPNIATIQTSKGLADKCYFLPVTPDCVRKVIQYERPDGIYCTFGGQTALNIGVQLCDEFEQLGVQVLGTQISTIMKTEDRELFANALAEISEKCAESRTAINVEEAIEAGNIIGYPVIVRAAYALGGLGSGFASNEEELRDLSTKAFSSSPQILVERSMKGWKEVEFEVVRDSADNCIVVCNMENFDPLGIHTGDSIVVAPCMTLSDSDVQMLRTTAIKVVRHLGVVGECNIQYALNPDSNEYCIIEVNARLSRSSALASKATGYPLAFVAAKLGLGIKLNSIRNSVTRVTTACFEPKLSSAMKSVGEVMAIGRTFEECLMEAIRSVESAFTGFSSNEYTSTDREDIDRELSQPTDKRLFAIANAFHLGYTVEQIWQLTRIDRWFLCRLRSLVETEKKLAATSSLGHIPTALFRTAKQLGFSDRGIAHITKGNEFQIRRDRRALGLHPFVKQIDTVAAEFPAVTNYLYLTYNASTHDVDFNDRGVMVLGSGVYRIGSSVEFDWCAVRAIGTLRANNYKTIMVNYNPETVSTDYDEADRLYFSNISLERVLDIYELEQSAGVVVAMGGQAPNNIALALHRQKVNILGTSPDYIDNAENRYKFSRMLDQIGIDQPAWRELTQLEDAHAFCKEVGFPVLVRPSYVLSGAAMNVVFTADDLRNYLEQAATVSREYPVVISKFIEDAKEIDVDAVAVDGKMIVHFISEHVENAGVHSGDATLVLPPQDLDPITVRKIEEATAAIGKALHVTGPYNIQFIAKNNEIKVIECNVRAARSFPFVSKAMNVDLVELSIKAMLKIPISYKPSKTPPKYVAVKVPQFSFSRLLGADPILGVEMASTGEVAAFGPDKYSAYMKALLATGFKIPNKNVLVSIGSYKEKVEMLDYIKKLVKLGFNIFATAGTEDFFSENNVQVKFLDSSTSQKYNMHEHLANNLIDLYINLPSKNSYRRPASFMSEGYKSRRMAIDCSIPLITNVKCAKMFIEALSRYPPKHWEIENSDYITSHRTVIIPGLVDIASNVILGGSIDRKIVKKNTSSALYGGFTTLSILSPNFDGQDKPVFQNLNQALGPVASSCFATDYVISVPSTASVSELSQINSGASVLYIQKSSEPKTSSSDYAAVSGIFRTWPTNLPIITDVYGTNLASTLLLASLFDRSVHITNVSSSDDLMLIRLSKEKGLNVSCDVSVFSLFPLPPSSIQECKDDLEVNRFNLWANMDSIDCFSVGRVPKKISSLLNESEAIKLAYSLSLPLLLSAVSYGKISVKEIVSKFSTNPRKILGLSEQPDTFIEVQLDRTIPLVQAITPISDKALSAVTDTYGIEFHNSLHRVVYFGTTVYLDGRIKSEGTATRPARDLSKDIHTSSSGPSKKDVHALSNEVSGQKSNIDGDFKVLPDLSPFAQISPSKSATLSKPKSKKIDVSGEPLLSVGVHSISGRRVSIDSSNRKKVNNMDFNTGFDDENATASGTDEGLDDGVSEYAESNRVVKARPSKLMPISYNKSLHLTFLPSILERFGGNNPFYSQSIISVRQLSKNHLYLLFAVAMEIRIIVEKHGMIPLLSGKVMASVFYEPSSRTSASFQAAMLRLGGQVFSINSESSSSTKGESLADTIRTFSSYADCIVLRHPDRGAARSVADLNDIPILNAGDGTGEHPTQAMLDVFTIREELGTVNGLVITMVGDLKNGRTVHSLSRVLALYNNITINYIAPTEDMQMPEYIIDEINQKADTRNIKQYKYGNLTDEILANTDVLYVTRIQKERFKSIEEYNEIVNKNFIVNNSTLNKCKKNMIVMHPLPRVNEISVDVDTDPRAAYFRQMKYGMYVRMALLSLVLSSPY
ncbi:hypothetical protein BB559_003596 [Furculomyces boomerangus]|uniref:Uncharacterized protein n=1 Tax=Furculomyces boomerangus TaxID=61424 RepID=A0A2T9YKA2_9FUNG|nr:hypothetical protein BB559_003596 [Furculomyces boomerangus]